MDDGKRHVDNFMGGLEGHLRNATRNFHDLWCANGGRRDVLPAKDDIAVVHDGDKIVVTVSPIDDIKPEKKKSGKTVKSPDDV
jgi:hypothetical protein